MRARWRQRIAAAADAGGEAADSAEKFFRMGTVLMEMVVEEGGFAVLFPHGMNLTLTRNDWQSALGIRVEAAPEPAKPEDKP